MTATDLSALVDALDATLAERQHEPEASLITYTYLTVGNLRTIRDILARPQLLPEDAVEVDAETFWAAKPEDRVGRLVGEEPRTPTPSGFWYLETPRTSRYFLAPAVKA